MSLSLRGYKHSVGGKANLKCEARKLVLYYIHRYLLFILILKKRISRNVEAMFGLPLCLVPFFPMSGFHLPVSQGSSKTDWIALETLKQSHITSCLKESSESFH